MAMAFSPRQDLAFLPHPRTPPSPNAPLHGFTAISGPSRPTYQRSRSHNSSKSAPTSPAGSLQVTGLTPLSKISSIELGQPVHAPSRSPVARTRSLHIPIPQRRVSHDAGGTSGIDIAQPRYASLPSTSHMSQPTITSPHQIMSSLPPLLNPAARIRTYPRVTPRSGSTSETETETSGNDSDATYRPHRHTSNVQPGPASASGSGDFDGMRNKAQSQPDLTALRSRLEGWAGGVAKETADPRRTTTLKRRTPPARSIPLGSQPTPGHQSPRSRSSIALSSLRRASPRELPATLSPLTPLLSTSSEGSSPRDHRSHLNVADPAGPYHTGEVTGSEGADADDDDSYEGLTDSPSSGSINFSSKRKGLRQRLPVDRNKGGLGLSFGPETPPPVVKKEDPIPAIIERRLQQSSLLSLRLLAVVPSVWGIAVLFQGFVSGEIGVDVWPWGVDLSRDALERLVAGGAWNEGTPRRVSRGDMLLAMAWALCTAHFCFCLTTGLTHRWRSYYSLPSTLTRLLSLQCLCWPATYVTLWFLGANRPLLAWIVIGVTTGWSRTVQLWVTSNVVPTVAGEVTPRVRPVGIAPESLNFWDRFTWGRTWDWDVIAREVGWKVGALLLVTTAWLFWGIETGRLVETV